MGVPSVSRSSSNASEHQYQSSISSSAVLIFSGRGNLYGFLVEENSGSDVFIQFFDAAAAVDVTVGTTVPDFTMRVSASSVFGKDVNDSPLHFFAKGCVVAVTTTRTGAVAPASGATSQFWFWNK